MSVARPPLDIDRELAAIPAAYQDAFRRALEQELAEGEQNQSDQEALAYLRRRREAFRQGGFLRPDGRPGVLPVSGAALYEQALPELAQNARGEGEVGHARRQLLWRVGLLALGVLLLVGLAWRGRAQRAARAAGTPTVAATIAAAADASMATAAPPAPELGGADEALRTVGGLGGALTLGRPSALTVRLGGTEQTIALPIDPSRTTPQGELRYNAAVMASDSPVAVWVYGTVVNYAVGLPDEVLRALSVGDRVTVATDTGGALHFRIDRLWQGHSHEATQRLSQNRVGLTLFALPAPAADAVRFAFAAYDVAEEEASGAATAQVGEQLELGNGVQATVTAVQFGHTETGALTATLSGTLTTGQPDAALVSLTLTAGSEQTPAWPLTVDADGQWTARLQLPETAVGAALLADLRAQAGAPATVDLGEIPDLAEQVEREVLAATYDAATRTVRVRLALTNPHTAAIYLPADYLLWVVDERGGDADGNHGSAPPGLPRLLEAGERWETAATTGIDGTSMQLQMGEAVWQVAGWPP